MKYSRSSSQLDSLIEPLDRLLELLLIQQNLSVIVVYLSVAGEILHTPLECRHGGFDLTGLVLRNAELNVREDEVGVKVDGLLILFDGKVEGRGDEVDYAWKGGCQLSRTWSPLCPYEPCPR